MSMEGGRGIKSLKYLELLWGEPGKLIQVIVGQKLGVEEPGVDSQLGQGGPAPPASSQSSSSPAAATSQPQGVMTSALRITN